MKIFSQASDFTAKSVTGPRVIVPTMGALHSGHLALIKRARELAGNDGEVVVTIFVNHTQFNNPNDFENYPRTQQEDIDLCRQHGTDIVFNPDSDAIYCDDHSVKVMENSLSNRLCGATRPGHFEGVCTVVLKLFNICRADIGVFGKKDFQQLAIIKRMVRDLNLQVRIEGVETVREESGLAMSSRNTRLNDAQLSDAPRIRKALIVTKQLYTNGENDGKKLLKCAEKILLSSELGTEIDYLELLDAETLQPIQQVTKPAVLAIALFYGEVRLIDNIELI